MPKFIKLTSHKTSNQYYLNVDTVRTFVSNNGKECVIWFKDSNESPQVVSETPEQIMEMINA